jgi:hypothetical protein
LGVFSAQERTRRRFAGKAALAGAKSQRLTPVGDGAQRRGTVSISAVHLGKQVVRRVGIAGVLAAGALALAACTTVTTTGDAGGSTTPTTSPGSTTTTPEQSGSTTSTLPLVPPSSVPPPAGTVVAPADVGPIVSADTAVNNRANATLSLTLQDSHEACLQQTMDDINYKAAQRFGVTSFGGAFDQAPHGSYVPLQSSYPASFSVLAEDVPAKGSGASTDTTAFLTYSKVSASSSWKLTSSSEILGPTSLGVAVPAAQTGTGGYATSLPLGQTDGLVMTPASVAARVATAFTTEAADGALPSGITAEFGPAAESADPHLLVQGFAAQGKVSVTFSTTAPAATAAAMTAPGCGFPTYRLADGGALVVFPLFETLSFTASSASGVAQPADQGEFGSLLAPGTYSSVVTVAGDVCVAIVPPAGSSAPVHVIGSGIEPISASGVQGGLVIT